MQKSDSRNETQKALQGDLFAAAQAGAAAPAMPDAAELELIARRKKAPKRLKNTEDDAAVSAASADDAPDAALASAGNADIAEHSPFVTASSGEPLRFAQAGTGTRTDASPDTPAGEPKPAAGGGEAAAAGGGISTPALIGGVVLLGAAAAGGGGGGGGGGSSPAPTDTTPPTVTITDNVSAATATGPVTFTFTFSEAVTGFTADDITVTGGTKGTLTAVSSTVYTLVVTPTANTTGTITVNVAAGVAQDLAGNANTAATQATQAFNTTVADTTPPTLTITDNVSAATANGEVTFTFTFSENVTNFTEGDIVVSGGTAGTFTQVSGSVYTLIVTPASNATGTLSVSVAAGAGQDAAGNGSNAASASQAFDTTVPDTTPPTVSSVTDNVTGTANLATTNVAYTYTFSESVTGLDASDFTVTNGTISGITGTGATRTVNVTPQAGVASGNISLVLRAAAVTDAAGNANTAAHTENTQAIDTVAPTVSSVADNVTGTANLATTSVAYTYTFSESVTGLDASDFTVTHGTISGITGTGATRTVTVTPAAGVASGNISLALAAGAFTDLAGNANTAAHTENTQAIDTVAPAATLTTATIAASGNATVQSSEAGTAYLVSTGVTVNGLASITGAADSAWNQVAITTANTNTNLAATGLANGTYKLYTVDAAGNLSAASDGTVTIATDSTPPAFAGGASATASMVENIPVQMSESYWTFDPRVYDPAADGNVGVTYSIVGGPDADKFVVTNATINPYGGADHATPTLVWPSGIGVVNRLDFETPTDSNGDGVYQFTVRATDAAGNFADQNVSLTITNDGRAQALEVIDLGAQGQLIMPFQVGGNWYYYWDRIPDFDVQGIDSRDHDTLDDIFTRNASNAANPTPANGTDDTYRFADLNGAWVALPTSDQLQEIASTVSGGIPVGWPDYAYWSATRVDATHHNDVQLPGGLVTSSLDNDTGNFVVFQYLGTPPVIPG